jgi:hypothetical protein
VGKICFLNEFANFDNSKPKGKITFLDHVKNVLIFCGVQNTSKVSWIQTAVEKVCH